LPTKSGTEIYITKSTTASSYFGISGNFAEKTYKWFRLTFQAKSNTVTNSIQIHNTAWTSIIIKNPALSSVYQDYEFIMKYDSGWGIISMYTTIPDTGSSIALNNITLSQAGWSNMD
jgi:hypothetical protein